jgi:SAM-dependent methyltransferase
VTCIVCGACLGVRHAQARDPMTLEEFRVMECSACGLGHTHPHPEVLARFYGPEYWGGRHGFMRRYCAWRRWQIVSAAHPERGKLLDIGCGEGSFLLRARAAGFDVVGTEMGLAAERSRAAGLDVRSSLEQVEPDAPFDVVTLWHSLEHFPDPVGVVEGVALLLKPGGTIVVAVPDAGGLQARAFGADWFHLDVPRHLFHFTRRSLGLLLAQHGFALVSWRHLELEYDLFGWLQSGLNASLGAPNLLFNALTGKRARLPAGPMLLHATLGAALVPAAAIATLVSGLSRRGATMIAVARAAGARPLPLSAG